MKTSPTLLLTTFLVVSSCVSCNNQSSDSAKLSENGLVDIFAQDLYIEQKTNDLKINPLVEGKAINQEILLSNLLKQEHKISILRINDSNCTLCIEAELEDVIFFKSILNDSKIAIFATFNSKRSLNLMLKGLAELNIPVFLIKDRELNLPIEQINAPYYFSLNQEYIINNSFIPIKGLEAISKSYFKAMADAYNSR
ncbi:hypothetical protein [Roseivirga sp.]|uniref:hypothetical protein n=1 Tax=Roseivirga sp. TaxID=1964215 RepID=UPI003B8AE5A5